MIKKEGSKYSVWSEDGKKRLGKPGSKAKAIKRLKTVEWFKHHPKKSYGDFLGIGKSIVTDHIDENTTVKTKELCLSLGLDYKRFMGV